MNQKDILYPKDFPEPRLMAEWEARARLSRDMSRSRREAEEIARARRARVRHDELVAGAITLAMLIFIAIALWCGPAANL